MLPHSIELRRAYIAFEADMDLKAAKKLAKSIMKEPEFRNSVLLMDTYAQLEYRSGKPADARKVPPKTPACAEYFYLFIFCCRSTRRCCRLRATCRPRSARTCFSCGRTSPSTRSCTATGCGGAATLRAFMHCPQTHALRFLCAMANEERGCIAESEHERLTAPLNLVRARKALENFLANTNVRIAVSVARIDGVQIPFGSLIDRFFCLAYFQYLTVGVDECVKVLDACAAAVPAHPLWAEQLMLLGSPHRLMHERFFISYAKLLHLHTVAAKSSPAVVRRVIDAGLEAYPHNPDLVTLFVLVESRFT